MTLHWINFPKATKIYLTHEDFTNNLPGCIDTILSFKTSLKGGGPNILDESPETLHLMTICVQILLKMLEWIVEDIKIVENEQVHICSMSGDRGHWPAEFTETLFCPVCFGREKYFRKHSCFMIQYNSTMSISTSSPSVTLEQPDYTLKFKS